MSNNEEDPISKILEIKNFSEKELENIYQCIHNKKKECEKIMLTYSEEDEFNINLYASKDNLYEKFCFYKTPVVLTIDQNKYKIYTILQCLRVLSKFNLRDYSIMVNGVKINNKQLNHKTIKSIDIQFDKKNLSEYIVRVKSDLPTKKSIIEIDKVLLSLYFDEICLSPNKEANKIDLIMDKNRAELIKKITGFLASENRFYLVLGTDGIGKTITLLYYTSSFFNTYKNLYLNLKLFLKYQQNESKIKEIFLNELKRLFLVYDNSEQNINDCSKEYASLINEINKCPINSSGINYFWDLLYIFIKQYDSTWKGDIFIVLDQYKNNNIDEDFRSLNKLSNLICSEELNNKFKLMILISINNFDTKNIFVENLSYISFTPLSIDNCIPCPNYRSNIQTFNICNDNQENNNNNINYEFIEIENFLNQKHKELQESFNNLKNCSLYSSQIYSKLIINTSYSEITKKDYINEVVDCRDLIDKNMNMNYKNCIEVFGYSLKYYALLLNEINNTEKLLNETDEEFSKRIVKHFYQKMKGKIVRNLDAFYASIYKKDDLKFIQKKIENLSIIDNSIYEEKVFPLNQMNLLLRTFPIKYLNFYIVGIDSLSIPLDNMDLSKFGFIFDYSNTFIRETIHEYYLKETSFNYKAYSIGGSGFGALFEELVNKKLYSLNADNCIKRNVFSLVGTGSKSYIKKIREKENFEFFEFYNLKTLNVEIDGIDCEKLTNNNCDFLNKDILLNQVSKCGRSFDIAILKKLPKTNSNDKTHNLILFQDTKDKISRLKDRSIYLRDAELSRGFLEKIYEGLKIDKIYLIFILPKEYNISETANKILDYNLYFILFNTNTNSFFDKGPTDVINFCIPEAELTFENQDYDLLIALSNIKISKNIMKISTRNYLGKKRMYDNKFINVYNKICHDNCFDCISVIIPNKLKKNILKELYKENLIPRNTSINFIPSTNCIISKLEKIFEHEKMLFIFSYDNNNYLFYYSYYMIYNDFSIVKTKFSLPNTEISYIKPKNNDVKSFSDILKYPLFCFCYNIIKEHNYFDFD